MNDKVDTKDKILDAAEALFAEHGFAETSLRAITTVAEVNLASVNYHFGSKKSLIQAVFDRFFHVFTEELIDELTTLEALQQRPELEKVLHSIVKPLLRINAMKPNGASIFTKLLSRAYAETQGHLKKFMLARYQTILARFISLVHKSCPDLPPAEMFWRLHFMLGTVIFTLAGSDALREIAEADFKQPIEFEGIIEKVLPFLAAGMQAEIR